MEHSDGDCWAESKAKERVGQNFVKSILELSGYKVMNYGIENHNMQIIRLISGNYKSETNKRLMCMPDFVVVDPETNEGKLVEVKYRQIPKYFNWKKTNFMFNYRTIQDYLEHWKDLILVFVLNVKPYCICVNMNCIDWNLHFKGKRETREGGLVEIWNFNGHYQLINETFPRVSDYSFSKAKEISQF